MFHGFYIRYLAAFGGVHGCSKILKGAVESSVPVGSGFRGCFRFGKVRIRILRFGTGEGFRLVASGLWLRPRAVLTLIIRRVNGGPCGLKGSQM